MSTLSDRAGRIVRLHLPPGEHYALTVRFGGHERILDVEWQPLSASLG